jgi:SAM-dependent methyltransferase
MIKYRRNLLTIDAHLAGTHIAPSGMLRARMKPEYIIREGIIHIRKVVRLVQRHGITFVIRLMVTILFGYYFYRIFKSSRTFLFRNRKHRYFYHHYNVTWASERAIEIPIVRGAMEERRNGNVLEFGNVLSHYFPTNHDILDMHERARHVVNQDVIDFRCKEKYDLIVSISTFEHVGWDEHLLYTGPEPHKLIRAFNNLKECLKPDGEMIITFPIGYNPILDWMIDSKTIRFTKLLCMKRVSADNAWLESRWRDVKNAQYDDPFISANALAIGYFKKNNRNGNRNNI